MLVGAYQFWLRDSSLVAVKNVEVTGISRESEEGRQIDQAVRTAMGEMTTLHVQPEILEQELARFPRVQGTEIDTSFPDSAEVTVLLREDGSIFGDGADALLIATDGTVLGPAAGQEDSLPSIGDGNPPASGDDRLSGRALRQALILGAAPPELRSYIAGSRATAAGVEVEMENGMLMLFGDPAESARKWRTAAALIADPSFDTGSYVDLTVPRRPAISAEPPAADPSADAAGDDSVASASG